MYVYIFIFIYIHVHIYVYINIYIHNLVLKDFSISIHIDSLSPTHTRILTHTVPLCLTLTRTCLGSLSPTRSF